MKSIKIVAMCVFVLTTLGVSINSYSEPGIPPKSLCRIHNAPPFAVVNSHRRSDCIAVLPQSLIDQHKEETTIIVNGVEKFHSAEDCTYIDPLS